MADDDSDKRHAPTERRLRQAAEQGDAQRSADLPRAAIIVLAITIGLGAGAGIGGRLAGFLTLCLAQAGTASPAAALGWTSIFVHFITPLLGLIGALSLGASFLTGGWVLSLQQLMPDLSKISPGHGLGQLFSRTGLMETLKSLAKFVIIGGVGGLMILLHGPDFAALAGASGPHGSLLLTLCLRLLITVCIAIGALAGVDVGLQFWLHRHKLRMTDAEVRNEMKDSVGNPQVRSRQRAMARRLARSRQMKRLPEASVVVTNPTHFAVAIRYRRGADAAPMVLAKGVGLLAAEIISKARGYGIPVVEAPPLARAIYHHVEPGEHVPIALYRACAEVLAYVWKMQLWRKNGGARPAAPNPSRMSVPDLKPAYFE
jgi:flagellar biosynthetic protein FlhB